MAVVLHNSIFLHIPKTGGEWVREVLWCSGLESLRLHPGERKHADIAYFDANNNFGRNFRFAFVRHPVSWYRSYFTYQIGRRRDIKEISLEQYLSGGTRSFGEFIQKVTEAAPGFLGRFYSRYVGAPGKEIDYIGRTEHLREDLATALRLAGETCPSELIEKMPPRNVSKRWNVAERFVRLIVKAEAECCERFGYGFIEPQDTG